MNYAIKKQMTSFDKNEFLNLTNRGLDFYKYAIEDLEENGIDKFKPTLCPFYDDTKPGFSIYLNYTTKRWNHKDHGLSPDGREYKGDVFDFAACYYNLDVRNDFHLIIKRMANDLNIQLPNKKESYNELEAWCEDLKFVYHGNPEDQFAWLIGFELFYRGNNNGIDLAYDYFKQFGITKEILKAYNVHAIDWYKRVGKDDKVESVRIWKSVLNIAYVDTSFAKFYNPDGPLRFWYVGSKPKDYTFGRKQILRRLHRNEVGQDTLIITGGEKDVLTLTSLGYDAICFNSETASIPADIIENFLPLYKRIVILFDIDDTGKRRTDVLVNELKHKFPVFAFTLPEELAESGGKDISDYVAAGLDVEKIKNEINQLGNGANLIQNKSVLNSEPTLYQPNTVTNGETPLLPENVYNDLPITLKTICQQFKNPRDKDLILLSALATISSFFPNVMGRHGGKKVGCNFFLFVVAPASSGKGVMTWSRTLGNGIQQHLKEKFKSEGKKYIADLKEYHATCADNPNAVEPEQPQQQTMFIPANCSYSMLIKLLNANQNFGVVFETEGDTLANTLNTEWGNFSDVLRRAFHHEPITQARRADNELLEVVNPHLSVVLSGTENQVGNLITDVENGFFSRIMFYSFRSKIEWQNQFTEFDNDLEEVFALASSTMLDYWHIQAGSERCFINIPGDYVAEMDRYFTRQLNEYVADLGDGIAASIKRFGLNLYRIAMILTIIRQLDEHKQLPESLTISNCDFKISMQIIDTLLQHLKLTYAKLDTADRTSKLNAKQRLLFENLPDDFTRAEYDKIAADCNIKYKTAERYIDIYIKRELLTRYDQGKYQKI